jgi:Tol biopolymer transport system component
MAPPLSPDGRWLATVHNTATGSDVFVQPMAAGDSGQSQVSQHGGTSPQWSPDGSTLFYTDGENVIAATVEPTGKALAVTGRRVFAPDRFSSETASNYTVMPDGKHLLIVTPAADLRYTIIVNWLDELRRKVAAAQ